MGNWQEGGSLTKTAREFQDEFTTTKSGSSLPALPDAVYPAGRLFIRLTDNTVWRSNGSGWDALSGQADQRRKLLDTARGYITETFPRNLNSQNSVLNAGFQYYHLVPFLKGDPAITGVDVSCHTAGSSNTLLKAGFLSLDLSTLLATSADEKAQFTTTGPKSLSMLAQYPVGGGAFPADVVLQFSLVIVGGTPPSLGVGHITGQNGLVGAGRPGGALLYAHRPSQTDLTAGSSGRTLTGSTVPIYAGVWNT